MKPIAWSGTLVIGSGWAAFDGHVGDNRAHAHLAHQVTSGFDGPIDVVGDGKAAFPKCAAALIPSGLPHALAPAGRRIRSVWIDPSFARQRIIGMSAIQRLADDQATSLRVCQTPGELETWAYVFVNRTASRRLDVRLSDAIARASPNSSPRDLANRLSMSASRLRQVSMADYGVPPAKLLQWRQVQLAARALSQTRSLAEAADAGGFADQAHFTRRLRQWFGVSPAAGLSALEIAIVG